jgi:lysophospholipase L1-like esterase
VKFFHDLAVAREPRKQITVINKGIGGDRVTGLRSRWHDDVLRHKPDWVSVKIGINDLHSALRNAPDPVTVDVYAEAYDEILARTRETLPKAKILLIDPFYISTERAKTSFRSVVLKELPAYIKVVDAMAKKYKTRHVQTHEMFKALLKHYDPDTFCPEPVHPNPAGHLAIADAVYDTLSR